MPPSPVPSFLAQGQGSFEQDPGVCPRPALLDNASGEGRRLISLPPQTLFLSELGFGGSFLPGLSIQTPLTTFQEGKQSEEGSLPGGGASRGSPLSMRHSPCSATQKISVIRSLPCLETIVAFFFLRAVKHGAVPFGEGAEKQRQLWWERAGPGWCGGEQLPIQPRALPASTSPVCVCVCPAGSAQAIAGMCPPAPPSLPFPQGCIGET